MDLSDQLMLDDLATLLAEREELKALIAKRRADGVVSQSVGDRSYSYESLGSLSAELRDLDRRIAALQAPRSSGTTYMRLGRGR
jgi:hypothetical protein